MDLIHKFLNHVAYPFTLITFCFVLPPLYLFKFFLSTVSFIFSDNVFEKVVLITGASSGIGEQLAYEYGRRGAFSAPAARRKDRLQRMFQGLMTVHCRRIIETVNHFGRLDHLVNNAGITSVCMFEEMPTVNDFRTLSDTNFSGSVYTTRFAVPQLRNSNGKIAVLSSSASWLPAPRMSVYNESKAALLSFFDTLRVELGGDIGIKIVPDTAVVVQGHPPVEVGLSGGAIEWTYRMFYIPRSESPHEEAPTKNALDLTGAKEIVYPPTIQSADPKKD
ncbi:hypothetical protein SLA2020_100400 [Shorea laevis]